MNCSLHLLRLRIKRMPLWSRVGALVRQLDTPRAFALLIASCCSDVVFLVVGGQSRSQRSAIGGRRSPRLASCSTQFTVYRLIAPHRRPTPSCRRSRHPRSFSHFRHAFCTVIDSKKIQTNSNQRLLSVLPFQLEKLRAVSTTPFRMKAAGFATSTASNVSQMAK
jgi:hypothetical protein